MTVYRIKGTAGPVINKAWDLEDRTVIGSDANSQVRIESESVAPEHAVLEVGESGITLRRLSQEADVAVNGEGVDEASLASGDEIRIGNCRWLVQAPGLRPQKVLTEAAVRKPRPIWPWLLAGGISALALLAWRLGYLLF